MKSNRSKKPRARSLGRPAEFHQKKVPFFLEQAAHRMRSAELLLEDGNCSRAVEELMRANDWSSTAWGHAQGADDNDASYDKVKAFTKRWAGTQDAVVRACVRERPARQKEPGVLTRLFRRGE